LSRKSPETPSWYPTVQGDLLSRVNLFRWIREWARAHEIDDFDYFEFGVLNGESVVEAIRQLRGGGLRHVTGFDTFAGIPALQEADAKSQAQAPSFVKGQYAGMSIEGVRSSILAATNFPNEQLSLVEGDFRESLASYRPSHVVGFPLVVHIDCDLYSSSASALEWCADIAGDGTWLLADDYWCYRGSSQRGQRRAIHDVLAHHLRVEITPYCNYKGFGRAFIINLK
jgi:hypothetical protein